MLLRICTFASLIRNRLGSEKLLTSPFHSYKAVIFKVVNLKFTLPSKGHNSPLKIHDNSADPPQTICIHFRRGKSGDVAYARPKINEIVRIWSISMKRLALAGFALTAAAGTALAADMPQAPTLVFEETIEVQQYVDWTGLYVGGQLGWAFSNFNNQTIGGNINPYDSGISGGVYGGYNMQVTPNVVVGLEGDFSLTDIQRTGRNGTATLNSSSDWNANVRGRLGYAFDRYMVYGAGGLAVADLELKSSGLSQSTTAVGWTLGAGAEALVTDNISARFEYAYQDFGDQDFNPGGTRVTSNLDNQQVRFGLGYKF